MDFFKNYKPLPPDAIFGITDRFNRDKSAQKYNLCVGVYYDEKGSFWQMPLIKEVAASYLKKGFNTNYQPISGHSSFLERILHLLMGEHFSAKQLEQVAAVQTLGGTGALRVGADFLVRGGKKTMYVSDPTWANHSAIFEQAGMEVIKYPYLEPVSMEIDFSRLKNFILGVKEGSVFLLHGCCHNPTGLDLNRKQWEELLVLLRKKKCLCFFDVAYLGFAHGPEEDNFPLQLLVEKGIEHMVAFSCSKTFTLYSERVGALSVYTGSCEEKEGVQSHLKQIVRRSYSNPPRFGAEVVSRILSDEDLKKQWKQELSLVRKRLEQNRTYLVEILEKVAPEQTVQALKESFGFFAQLGLKKEQVENLYSQGIYLTGSSRVNLAAINEGNVDFFLKALCTAFQQ